MSEVEKEVINLLGGERLLGKSIHNTFDLVDLIQEGFPTLTLFYVKECLSITDNDLALNLGISEKTLHRYRNSVFHGSVFISHTHSDDDLQTFFKKLTKNRKILDYRLNPVTSDRLYRFAKIYAMAVEVFGELNEAQKWLRSPQIGLNGRIPLELIATEAGAQEVKDLLGRIEYGVFS
ncbi:MAG: DUF2384 domain-containing protein [Candidatus Manganitrophus sp. SA1]|nr:DUF2384 domain-containing protein [Candidatus Manganitrophus morganii]